MGTKTPTCVIDGLDVGTFVLRQAADHVGNVGMSTQHSGHSSSVVLAVCFAASGGAVPPSASVFELIHTLAARPRWLCVLCAIRHSPTLSEAARLGRYATRAAANSTDARHAERNLFGRRFIHSSPVRPALRPLPSPVGSVHP